MADKNSIGIITNPYTMSKILEKLLETDVSPLKFLKCGINFNFVENSARDYSYQIDVVFGLNGSGKTTELVKTINNLIASVNEEVVAKNIPTELVNKLIYYIELKYGANNGLMVKKTENQAKQLFKLNNLSSKDISVDSLNAMYLNNSNKTYNAIYLMCKTKIVNSLQRFSTKSVLRSSANSDYIVTSFITDNITEELSKIVCLLSQFPLFNKLLLEINITCDKNNCSGDIDNFSSEDYSLNFPNFTGVCSDFDENLRRNNYNIFVESRQRLNSCISSHKMLLNFVQNSNIYKSKFILLEDMSFDSNKFDSNYNDAISEIMMSDISRAVCSNVFVFNPIKLESDINQGQCSSDYLKMEERSLGTLDEINKDYIKNSYSIVKTLKIFEDISNSSTLNNDISIIDYISCKGSDFTGLTIEPIKWGQKEVEKSVNEESCIGDWVEKILCYDGVKNIELPQILSEVFFNSYKDVHTWINEVESDDYSEKEYESVINKCQEKINQNNTNSCGNFELDSTTLSEIENMTENVCQHIKDCLASLVKSKIGDSGYLLMSILLSEYDSKLQSMISNGIYQFCIKMKCSLENVEIEAEEKLMVNEELRLRQKSSIETWIKITGANIKNEMVSSGLFNKNSQEDINGKILDLFW